MRLLACLLVLFSAASNAQEVWHRAKIYALYPLGDGNAAILFVADSPQCTNAATPNKYYHITVGANGMTAAGFKTIYSTALTAATLGKDVTIAFNSGSGACEINRLLAQF